jgi:cytoskeletal protein CcmA (bactofilin family)
MALFSKEPEKNVRVDPNARMHPQSAPPPAPPIPPLVAATGGGMHEKAATPSRPAPAPAAETRAYLDSGSKISGKLSFESATRIDGQVDGEIVGKDSITIGESAVVTAQVRAASIVVAGKVSGDIVAVQRIEIRPSAKVIGNLTAPVLVVHEGALFEGHCSMQPETAHSSKVTVFPKDERTSPSVAERATQPAAERAIPVGAQKQA